MNITKEKIYEAAYEAIGQGFEWAFEDTKGFVTYVDAIHTFSDFLLKEFPDEEEGVKCEKC